MVGALDYARPAAAGTATGRPLARVARYASDDVYGELRSALEAVARVLVEAGHRAVVVADDNALVDREAARRAGLGYYGKNSNVLLANSGSWFVLGSVVTDAVLPPAVERVPDGCGPCRRCLDGCPTGAIVAPGVVDARRCLAWLLQATGDFPVEFREALGDRLYGCDDCQEVCPPNRRLPEACRMPVTRRRWTCWTCSPPATRSCWSAMGAGTSRSVTLATYGATRSWCWAISLTGGDPEVSETLRRYREHPDRMLAGHAAWAASRLGLEPDDAAAAVAGGQPESGDDPAGRS